MVKIGIITGSIRDSRVNLQVTEWVKILQIKGQMLNLSW